jgi:hypothetical protein
MAMRSGGQNLFFLFLFFSFLALVNSIHKFPILLLFHSLLVGLSLGPGL